jgi:hypothetical protein
MVHGNPWCSWSAQHAHRWLLSTHMLRKDQLADGFDQGLTAAEQFYNLVFSVRY